MVLEDKGLFFIPLGGSEQFGVNLNVYICDGRLLAVDCGMGFADENFPGIDLLLPDPAFLEENREELEGLIITHAHEDHIGAVGLLAPDFRCPVYATAFTAKLVESKLEERQASIDMKVIDLGARLKIGPFDIEFVTLTHSIPEPNGVIIRT
ncbi:MAG TPA: MBL fold hydrolase, partial [Rhodospirillaceae bacterium]|nr:MBL fold hydrolase [Rhodospirillaceae bacterium]